MPNIGLNLDTETVKKLKIISLATNKNRTQLIKEGLKHIEKKYENKVNEFKEYVKEMGESK